MPKRGNQPSNGTTFNLFLLFSLSANVPSRPQVRVHGFVNSNSNRYQKRVLFIYDLQIRNVALSMNQGHVPTSRRWAKFLKVKLARS